MSCKRTVYQRTKILSFVFDLRAINNDDYYKHIHVSENLKNYNAYGLSSAVYLIENTDLTVPCRYSSPIDKMAHENYAAEYLVSPFIDEKYYRSNYYIGGNYGMHSIHIKYDILSITHAWRNPLMITQLNDSTEKASGDKLKLKLFIRSMSSNPATVEILEKHKPMIDITGLERNENAADLIAELCGSTKRINLTNPSAMPLIKKHKLCDIHLTENRNAIRYLEKVIYKSPSKSVRDYCMMMRTNVAVCY
jgi:hypothetical protein